MNRSICFEIDIKIYFNLDQLLPTPTERMNRSICFEIDIKGVFGLSLFLLKLKTETENIKAK